MAVISDRPVVLTIGFLALWVQALVGGFDLFVVAQGLSARAEIVLLAIVPVALAVWARRPVFRNKVGERCRDTVAVAVVVLLPPFLMAEGPAGSAGYVAEAVKWFAAFGVAYQLVPETLYRSWAASRL